MDGKTIAQVFLFAFALSMDAFAVSVTDGLVYKDINKKKCLFIALVFGLMQAIMPLIGYWLIEGISRIVGAASSEEASRILSLVVIWVAFALLVFVGGKMLIGGIKDVRRKDNGAVEKKSFRIKEVLLYGVLTSIDALAVGVSFHAGVSTNTTIWLHATIILVITFILSMVGLLLGGVFNRLLKGKYEIACIIGGSILLLLAVWVVTSHYIGL